MQKRFTQALLLLLGGLPLLAQAQYKPDLVPVAPFTVPARVVAGSAYPLSAVIKNQGTNGAQFTCIGYYLSADAQWDATDAYLGASCQGLLLPGQSGTCALTATIPARAAGSQYLLLVADPLNAEQESDETNNVVSFPVAVAASTSPLPDLELWRPSLAFGAVPPGGTTGAFTFLLNRGPGATGAYELGFYLSADTVFSAANDVFLGLVTGGGLAAPTGAGTGTGTVHSAPVLTIPAGTAPGRYYLVFMADPRNLIAETNEANNSRALPLQVTGTLAAAGAGAGSAPLAPYPNPVRRGSPLYVAPAGGGLRQLVACYDATGRLASRQAVGGPGGPASFNTGELPAGLYLLRLGEGPGTTTHRVQID